MNEPDPIQKMIEQLAGMVHLVQKKKMNLSDEPIAPGIDEMLDDLENQVALFCGITKETLKEIGLSEDEIAKRLKNPPEEMKVDEKRKIRQLNYLKTNVDNIQWMLGHASKEAKKSLANPASRKNKKEKKKRKHKKRYKRLGGDEKWKAV